MKMSKLMAAASAAALFAGAASAQLAFEQASVTSGSGATSDISAPYSIAEEVDFVGAAGTAQIQAQMGLDVLTQGVIPPGQNIFLTIQATNATFTGNLNGSEFGAGITGAVVDNGGTTGDSFVRYLITTDTVDNSTGDGTRDGVELNLPIEMSGCGDVTFSVTEFQTETAGTPIEGGSAVLSVGGLPTAAITCDDAYQANLVVDMDNTTLDFTGGFTNFVVAAPDTATTAVLGDFDFLADAAVNIDLGGTAASPGDVIGFMADVNFVDDTNIVDGTAAPAGGDTLFDDAGVAAASNTIALNGTAAASNATETGTFEIQINGTGPVSAQTVSVSGAVLDLDTTLGLLATDAFLTADVEDLKLNGQYFGPFDWVSDSTKRVNSIFRITGLDGLSDIPAQVIVQRSRNGAAFNGTFPFTVLASDVEGSEVRMNSAALDAIAGLFGTADIALVFSTDLDLDVDRLLAGPSTAVVVPFGDGANQDGSGTTVPTTPPSTANDDDGNF